MVDISSRKKGVGDSAHHQHGHPRLGDDRAGVGVLLVHGIGQQPYGSTLANGMDAIVNWLQARIGDPEGESPDPSRKVVLDSARLRQSELEPGEPAHAYVRLSDRDRNDETWLVVESWWADSFARPSYGRMVRWTVRSAIATVSGEVAELYERLVLAMKSRRAWHSLQAMLGLYLYTLILAPALLLVVLLSIAAFLPWIRPLAVRAQGALTGSVGDSYALVRSPATRAAIVSKTKQDLEWLCEKEPSRILVIAHSQGAEVARQALIDSECLDGRSLRLITYGSGIRKLTLLQKLRSGSREIPSFSVAIGSTVIAIASIVGIVLGILFLARQPVVQGFRGLPLIQKVPALIAIVLVLAAAPLLLPRNSRDRDRLQERGLEYTPVSEVSAKDAEALGRWLSVRFYSTLSLAALVAVGVSCYDMYRIHQILTNDSPDNAIGAVPLLFIPLLLALVLGSRVAAAVDQINTFYVQTPKRDSLPSFEWWDVLASSDPVSSAGLQTEVPGQPKTFVIHNLRSILFDHTRYWQNWSEFTPRVLQMMHGVSDWSGKGILRIPRSWLVHESGVRARQTTTLVVLRIEAALIATGLILDPPNFFGPTERGTLRLVQEVSIRNWPNPDNRVGQHIVGALLLAVAALIPYWAALFFWRASQRRRRNKAIGLLRLMDQAMASLGLGDDLDLDKSMVTRVVARRRESFLLLTPDELHLFPLLNHGEISAPKSIRLNEILDVRQGLGAVRVLLPDEHLHIKPIDFMSRRTLKDYLDDAMAPLRRAPDGRLADVQGADS